MRLGIQTKLVGTLVLAGLVPLLLSLAVLVFSVFRVRTASVGQAFQAAARQEANHMGTTLAAQLELAYLLSRLPGTSEFLQQSATTRPSDDEIAEIEARWPSLTPADEPLRSVLDNPVAARWRAVRQHRVRFAEVMITDATGRLVSATNQTTDYFQGDEEWWRASIDSPPGTVNLRDSAYDESAIGAEGQRGIPVLDVCMPLYPDGEEGAVLGVMKVSIDTAWLSSQLQSDLLSGFDSPRVGLIHATGVPVGAEDEDDVSAMLSAEALDVMRARETGWIVSRTLGEDVVGFAAVTLPESRLDVRTDLDWSVVVAASRRVALAPLYRLIWVMLLAGLLTAGLWFAGGWWIARREIIRPILELRKGAEELGRGNINYRLPDHDGLVGRGLFRNDEIGQLARDFNRMADHLRAILQQLERADLLKQQFIDVASHELRTPVTYILGLSQLADRSNGNPLLAKILPKAKRLGRIVDNMFKLLQSGSFETTLHIGPVNVGQLIAVVTEELQPFLQERHQRLDVQVADDLPIVQADADKVRDVLANLLSNAVRFSPNDTIITVKAGPATGGVEVLLVDRGVGIPPEDLPDLFEPFFPAPRGGTMHHTSGEYAFGSRGIGLGLSVVKRFVDLHGGQIEVASSDKGTTVRVWFPMVAVASDSPPTDGNGSSSPAPTDPAAAI